MPELLNGEKNVPLHGNCVDIMSRMKPDSIDFVITDPSYITRYCSSDGRKVANDDNALRRVPSLLPRRSLSEFSCS